ncbi:MAG: PAS domain S-box protein [Verrucomicrobiota bacterium]
MRLRDRTLLVVFITTAILIAVLHVLARFVVMQSFAEHERDHIRESMVRCSHALAREIETLDRANRDWAWWDDTYEFIKNRNKAYELSNMTDATFEGLRLDFMVFINRAGEVVLAMTRTADKGLEARLPQGLERHLGASSRLVALRDPKSHVSGLILLPEAPALVSSRPIVRSTGEGPVRGALVTGRFLDREEIQELADTVMLSLRAVRADEPMPSPDFEEAKASLAGQGDIGMLQKSRDIMQGYVLLEDIYGRPALIIRAEMPRTAYARGLLATRQFLLLLLVAGLVFALAILVLLRREVVAPMGRLGRWVARIRSLRDLPAPSPLRGTDEVSDLAAEVSIMLNALEKSERALRVSEVRYEAVVESQAELICRIRPDGSLTFVNSAFCRFFATDRQRLLGHRFSPWVSEKEAQRVEDLHASLSPANPQAAYEHEVVRGDGNRRVLQTACRAFFDPGGNVLEFQCVSRDVTELREAGKRQEEISARLRGIVEAAEELIRCGSLDELYRRGVELAREKLGLERCAIFVEEGDSVRGTFGTNLRGETTDERAHLFSKHTFWFEVFGPQRAESPPWSFVGDKKLYEWDGRATAVIGESWVVKTPLVAADGGSVAVFSNDAAITRGSCDPARQDLLAVYSSVLAGMIERKRAEKALRASEERYRRILETTSEGAWILAEDGRTTFVNEKMASMLGYTQAEILGQPAQSFVFEEDQADHVLKEANRLRALSEVYERRLRRKDGSPLWAIVSATPIQDAEKRYAGSFAMFNDVAERKRAEEELRESEERWRNLVERAPDVIYTLASDATISSLSPVFEKITGWSREEWLGKPFAEIVHPDDLPGAVASFEAVLRGEHPPPYELRIRSKVGGYLVGEFTSSPLVEGGRVVGELGIARDVRERKRAEEALRASEAQLSNALKMARAGHWEYDVGSDTFTFNDNFYRIFRTTAEKVGGYKMSSADYARRFCHPEDAPIVGKEVQAAIEATDPNYERQMEHRILYADGEIGHMAVRFFIVKDGQGRTAKTYGVNQDITERKRAEGKMKQQLDELQRWHEATLGREERIAGLKREVNEFLTRLGEKPKYAKPDSDGGG